MSKTIIRQLILGCLLTSSVIFPVHAGAAAAQQNDSKYAVSVNVPLDSTVYEMIVKLDGLGYLQEMRPSTKPYTRLQVSKWVQKINTVVDQTAEVPPYARVMVEELNREFAQELKLLQGETGHAPFILKEVSIAETYYDGDTLAQQQTQSSYQPLNINNNGYRYEQKTNETLRLRFEGNVSKDFAVSATPRIAANTQEVNTRLETGYLVTHVGGLAVQLGKDAMWWGPGQRGSMVLTNNAEPLTGLKLSTLKPIPGRGLFRPLGDVYFTSFYGKLDDRSDVQNPGFFGFRTDIVPGRNITLGASLTSIMGGAGHGLSGDDYWDFITGKNAETAAEDKWNSIAGFDVRIRLPELNGVELYGELYGEDQSTALGFIPSPSRTAGLVGIFIPRLSPSGNWDAVVEWGHTSDWWYRHWVYNDGYVHKDNILGDAQGWNAERYYARLTHYTKRASSLSLHFEHLDQDVSNPSPQQMDSFWLSAGRKLNSDTTMNILTGISRIDNAGYVNGKKATNHRVSISLVKKY